MSMTPNEALLAIDAAIAQLHIARRVVEEAHGVAANTEPEEGPCKHRRTHQTFGGAVCADCGEAVGDGVSSAATAPPGS